jgi:hypothetical protein
VLGEARRLDRNLVAADGQAREAVAPVGVGLRRAREVGLDVARRDGGAGDGPALLAGGGAGDGAGRLRRGARGEAGQQRRDEQRQQ